MLRHPSSLLPAPEDLRWAVQASDDSEGPNGALLRGGAADPAAAALRGYTAGPPPAFTAQPLHVEAVLTQTATVGQVNQVLRRTATRISGMRPNNRMLSLRMEPGEGLASMERRLGVLQDSGAFERLQPVHVPGLGAAGRAGPGELPPPDAEPDFDDHRDI